ncbi:phage tail assembly protein T [Streptomyces cucumeris]|uniref:phage tail assembly protein T n=1 Tax=Streptomyces cucumeris TaxID=2962890 RepID=UPI003D74F96B
MTVRRLLAETGSRELAEWAAYERITGPLDGRRGDVQAAIVAATVANSQRTKGRPLQPKDFIPKWDKPKAMTPEEMWAAAMQANAALGGTVTTTPE